MKDDPNRTPPGGDEEWYWSVRGAVCPGCGYNLVHMTSVGSTNAAPIDPNRLYTAKEAAPLLGLDRVDTVYELGSTHQLPVTRTGPKGGSSRYLGADIIAFLARRTRNGR